MTITKLTADQQAMLIEKRDEWIRHGLSTAPADRAAAEDALARAFAEAGKPPPKAFRWLSSPMGACLTVAMLRLIGAGKIEIPALKAPARKKVRDQVRDQVLAQVRDQVRDQVRAQVRDQVRDQVSDQVLAQVSDQIRDQVRDQVLAQVSDQIRAQIRDQVSDQVSAQIRAQIRAQVSDQVLAQVRDQVSDQVLAQVSDQIRAQIRAQVRDQVSDQVRDQVRDQVSDQVRDQVSDQVRDIAGNWWWDFGAFSSYWVSYYEVMKVLGVTACDRLNPLRDLAMSAGWAIVFPDVAFMVDRPSVLHLDDQGRLHCEDGPAIAYRDGWGLFRWHGFTVPDYVITNPEHITVEIIDREENAETKRIMIERFGVGRYLRESGATLVDFDQVEVIRDSGKMMPRALLRDKHGNQYLEGTDGSTDRSYFMSVDPEVRTCCAAHESICGLDESRCVAQS